ncbi:NPP1 family protein [Sinorhizobium meliloti]|uniref:NPP1 family protein n=1 Tax=Rhizobium meliloti TaxID=382 RepID=UPI000FD95864|nr:NPP1 family protein [Sinorhizobium meliloti]RVG83631.1 necrosis-inducing protein [Sinorhizobium meliloti]RVI37209.1 necrosis-inducing protein [Sinorhizobium meliloti]RVI42062.1 necrosis-inducing protein [Sinorhizobium meliloti]RVJ16100.1 necrosis-inducing protein [Sinorhizobium meliloti]RVJ88019.1 necrosis-inducing protein [Sinorhizobium meliloti]
MTRVSPLNGRMLLTALMFVFVCGLPMPARAAEVIDHDKVEGFPEKISGFLETFQPFLMVYRGCVPFPAVDADGNVSGGLEPSGAMNGHCSRSIGQVYVRAEFYRGRCGIMYSWYFPKEQNVDGPGNMGHRSGWQNIVVWTDACESQSHVIGVSYSSHGHYDRDKSPQMEGTHPKVAYHQSPFPINPSLSATREPGGMQPAISWDYLTPAARQTLNNYNFGKAVPFNDDNFRPNLGKAY